jgi:hypothetical protein
MHILSVPAQELQSDCLGSIQDPTGKVNRNTFFAPRLNRRKPVLEGVHIAERSIVAFISCHSFLPRGKIHFLVPFRYGKVMAK